MAPVFDKNGNRLDPNNLPVIPKLALSETNGPPQDTKSRRANISGIGPGIFDENSGFVGGYNQLSDMFGLDAQSVAAPNGVGYGSGFTKTDVSRMPNNVLLGYGVNAGPPIYAPKAAPPPQIAPQPNIAAMFGSAFLPGGWGSPAFNGMFPANSDTPLNLPRPAAPRAPSSGSDGGSSIGDMFGAPVTLASGKQARVGATGTAQGGRYTFTVQPDGSVIDAKTGRVTAPAPTRTINKPLGPQNNSDGRWNGVLDQFGMIL